MRAGRLRCGETTFHAAARSAPWFAARRLEPSRPAVTDPFPNRLWPNRHSSSPPPRWRRAAAAAVLAASALLAGRAGAETRLVPPPADQPANVGEAKDAATAYHDSGRYARDLAAVAQEARAWIAERAPQVERPAVVFDIDETVLSNWPVIRADDYGRIFGGPCAALPEGPCGWVDWDLMAASEAIGPSRDLYAFAKSKGISVFFITGRDEPQRAATEKALQAQGFAGYDGLDMVPYGAHFASAADFKAPRRAAIEARGFSIIANLGDQPSDLAGGHAERAFQLPNPFYRIP